MQVRHWWLHLLVVMNILRLIHAEKEKKKLPPNPEYEKLKAAASCKDKGECSIHIPKDELKKKLDPTQFRVTQQAGTERAFSGKYLRMKEEGLYTCVVCENALFKSDQKFDSGCGWPAFSDVIAQGKVSLKKDTSHGMTRTEVTCARCGAHLGHVFDDGPLPTGSRYCINSAALNFWPDVSVDNDGNLVLPRDIEKQDNKENVEHTKAGNVEKMANKIHLKSEL